MRIALSSLIVAAGLATAAQAQDPAAQPAQPAAQPATPPAPPAAATAQPPAAPAAPAPAAEAPPAPAPVPTLPTSGYGYEAIQILERVCVPLVKGQKMADIGKSLGFRMNRRDETWSRQFGPDKGFTVVVQPQFSNKTLCTAELRYPMGQDVEIAKALNVWAFVHQPPLDPTANYTQPQDPDGLKRVRRSWEYLTATESIGLNFSTVRRPDDSPLNAKWDTGVVSYQERKL
jgi:hypothetical protein